MADKVWYKVEGKDVIIVHRSKINEKRFGTDCKWCGDLEDSRLPVFRCLLCQDFVCGVCVETLPSATSSLLAKKLNMRSLFVCYECYENHEKTFYAMEGERTAPDFLRYGIVVTD